MSRLVTYFLIWNYYQSIILQRACSLLPGLAVDLYTRNRKVLIPDPGLDSSYPDDLLGFL
jgi:hypothetical protein